MDLLSVAKLLAPLAPVAAGIAGGAFGGPLGAKAASGLVSIIMGKFGIDAGAPNATAQLSDRIAEAGEETARAKINASMEQARAEIQGFVDVERAVLEATVKNLSDVNTTMRSETEGRIKLALAGVREHWFFTAGRPASLWVFNAVALGFGLMLLAATAKEVWLAPDPLKTLAAAWPLFFAYFIPLAALNGVYLNGRSNEKTAAITAGVPMPNAKPSAGAAVLPTEAPKIPIPAMKPSAGPGKAPAGDRPGFP